MNEPFDPGARIHPEHPFATPSADRRPERRLRGRLVGPLTVVTAGDGPTAVGLTVSSLMMADGEPAVICALVDPDSDLADAVEAGGRAVVNVLRWRHRTLADVFAGLHPSPGGPFRTGEWTSGAAGPVLADAAAVAEVTVTDIRPAGWSALLTAMVDAVTLPDIEEDDLLAYARGRYRTVSAVRGG
ncbi:flavin reductase family protein [Fodinicola acaciae]|uniref:flavin reductase family protein n=1 Tax=Fodinicola acaciae TaxID=2681555 RepID=UPI0013D2BC3F|nr:flavin reductase family protein [Fodinicola acaciae]